MFRNKAKGAAKQAAPAGKPKRMAKFTATGLRRAAAYLRRSDTKQKDSIEDQRKWITEYAAKHGYEIVVEYVDDGISGDDTEKRAAFLRMRDDAGSGKFQFVICWNQDRFGRFDSMDAGYYVKPFRDAGVMLVTIDEGVIDWSDFTNRLMYTVKQEGKHQFLRDLSRNVVRGQAEAAKAFSWIGAVPYAYKIVGEKKAKRLELYDPAKERVVQRIFTEYVEQDRSMTQIAARLNAAKIPSPRGNEWRSDVVKVILRNVAYIGTYRSNATSRAKYGTYQNGEYCPGPATGQKAVKDWNVKPDHHPAIVDKAIFERAQAKLDKGKTGQTRYSPDNNPYLLCGKLVCSKCGGQLYAFNKPAKGGTTYRYYECIARKESGSKNCVGTTVREDEVIRWMSDYLDDYLSCGDNVPLAELERLAKKKQLSPGDLPTPFAKLREMFVKDAAPKADGKRIEKEIKQAQAELKQANANLPLVKAKHIPKLEQAIEDLERKLSELSHELSHQPKPTDINTSVLAVLESLWLFGRGDRDSVRAALQQVESIVCVTTRTGAGTGRRHRLCDLRVNFVRAVQGRLNPYHSA